MASPFKFFRRNQKQMLVVLTILTVISFTFGYIIMDLLQSSQRGIDNPIAFKSKYGELRESELHLLRERHQRTMGILGDLLQSLGYPPQRAQMELEYMFGGTTLDDVAESWLLSRRAEESGMVVSDLMINEFLKQITHNQVKAETFQNVFRRSGVSERMFFDLMRAELLVWKSKQLFFPSVLAATPGQRWDYFCRITRLARVEAAALNVADYLDRVEKEPTDEELRTFFEAHKDKLPLPYSPEPGFKRPQRVALEYFKAETDKFIAPELISDEEVLQRYEKDKEKYYKLYPALPPETPAPKDEPKPGDGAQSGEKQPESKPTEPAQAEPQAEPKREEQTPQPPEAAPKPPQTERKGPAEPKKEGAALGVGGSPYVLSAFQQPEENPAPSPQTPDPSPQSPTPSPQPPTPSPQPPAPGPQTPAPGTQPSTPEPQPPATGLQPPTPGPQPLAPAPAGPSEAAKKAIRREIASEKINAIFDRLSKEMDRFRQQQTDYEYNPTAKKEGKSPPAPPNFDQLAQENGLVAGRTGLVAEWDAAESEIGSAFTPSGARAWQFAFRSMAKLRPETAFDLSGNEYLFWKINEAKEEIPKFEDEGVRDEVLRAWKMTQAREIALKEAELLAAEARKSGKPLAEVFAGRAKPTVLTPPPFPWMTLGNVSLSFAQQAEISDVEGIDYAGEEFMRTVFKLEPEQVGTAMNAPKTAAYVVRLVDFSPPYKVIWDRFKGDDFRKYAAVAQSDRNAMYRGWLDEIRADAGFEWTKEHAELMKRNENP